MGRKTVLGEGCLKTPRAALAIPACGVVNPRVRRLEFPRAAFGVSPCENGNFTLFFKKNPLWAYNLTLFYVNL